MNSKIMDVVIAVVCVMFVVSSVSGNPCHGAHPARHLEDLDHNPSPRETVGAALREVERLTSVVEDLEDSYEDQGRFGGVDRVLEEFHPVQRHSGVCTRQHVHVKRGAVYGLLHDSHLIVRDAHQGESLYPQRSPSIRHQLHHLAEGVRTMMCLLHMLPCRITTYSAPSRLELEDVDTPDSLADRFSRDLALFRHLKQVLHCTRGLLGRIQATTSPSNDTPSNRRSNHSNNRCGGAVVSECGVCDLLP